METRGSYIVLRSDKDGSETRAYSIDSKQVADKLTADFILLGFNCKVVDADEEFARA